MGNHLLVRKSPNWRHLIHLRFSRVRIDSSYGNCMPSRIRYGALICIVQGLYIASPICSLESQVQMSFIVLGTIKRHILRLRRPGKLCLLNNACIGVGSFRRNLWARFFLARDYAHNLRPRRCNLVLFPAIDLLPTLHLLWLNLLTLRWSLLLRPQAHISRSPMGAYRILLRKDL